MSKKKLIAAIGGGSVITGGAIVIVILIASIVLVGAISLSDEKEKDETILYAGISEETEKYRILVTQYCEQYEIQDYVDLVLAVMMQESAGKGLDPMQSAECPFNILYPNVPGGITNPEYSVQCGVQYLANCLSEAGVTGIDDMINIPLALQGYNFGNGYIAWAKAKGGYNKEHAAEFAKLQAERLGWASYGDINYVPNVLRYYCAAGAPVTEDGYLTYPLAQGTFIITDTFGFRTEPVVGMHSGVDFGAALGTPVYATEKGAVSFAGTGSSSNGYNNFGQVIVINHGNGYSTLYAHNSFLNVGVGDVVNKGQKIAEVGNTGLSFGYHCHLEVRKNGDPVDPMPFLQGNYKIS